MIKAVATKEEAAQLEASLDLPEDSIGLGSLKCIVEDEVPQPNVQYVIQWIIDTEEIPKTTVEVDGTVPVQDVLLDSVIIGKNSIQEVSVVGLISGWPSMICLYLHLYQLFDSYMNLGDEFFNFFLNSSG